MANQSHRSTSWLPLQQITRLVSRDFGGAVGQEEAILFPIPLF